MKYFSTLAFSFLSMICLGQNDVPAIEITGIEVDETSELVTVNYSLNDADGDACDVWLKMSVDGGTYHEVVSEANLTGDAGAGISSSETLSLT